MLHSKSRGHAALSERERDVAAVETLRSFPSSCLDFCNGPSPLLLATTGLATAGLGSAAFSAPPPPPPALVFFAGGEGDDVDLEIFSDEGRGATTPDTSLLSLDAPQPMFLRYSTL